MKFAVGIKVVAFVSVLLGLLLLGGCGWTLNQFIKGEIRTKTIMDSLETSSKAPARTGNPEPLTSTIESLNDQIKEVKAQWKEFKPFLMGSGGVAIAAGIIQVVACLLVLCAGPKGARSRSGCFKCTHFLICLLLVVSLVVPAVFDMHHGSLSFKLQDIFHKIKEELQGATLDENFSPSAVTVYYGVIAVDIVGVVLLIISTCCLMRNADYDYREYP